MAQSDGQRRKRSGNFPIEQWLSASTETRQLNRVMLSFFVDVVEVRTDARCHTGDRGRRGPLHS